MALFSKKKEERTATDTQKAVTDAATKKPTQKKRAKKSVATSVFAHVLMAPVVTEKAYMLSERNKYVFRVHPRATKAQVAKAVADIYGVTVTKVNMMVKKQQNTSFRGIKGTTKRQKKAVVTIDATQKIDLFE